MNPSIYSTFPFSEQKGTSTGNINKKRMIQIAKESFLVSSVQVKKILEKHNDFLMSGGAGGNWKTILIDGLVVGLYEGKEPDEGEQANFERMNISKHSFENEVLPFANFCGSYARAGKFQNADLSYGLFTDAYLEQADFRNANLKNVDFSRADLRNADFRQSNLTGVDFENCDLTGADFRDTNFQNARFPGAVLNHVKY